MMGPDEVERLRQLAAANGFLPLGSVDEIAAALNSQRPKIRLLGDDRELKFFAEEIGATLRGQEFYRRDRALVGVNREKARLEPITPQAFRSLTQRHIVFFKEKNQEAADGKQTTIQIVKTMIVDTARAVMESWDFLDCLPEIERVNPIRLPYMRSDSSIGLAPMGYHDETHTYTLDGGVVYDESMTVERALEVLSVELLGEMPFHDDGRSKAVQLAAMLTVFAIGLVPKRASRPGFVFTANDSDAGKTLAAKMAIIPIHGKVSPRGLPRKEEMRKVLDQIAMEAAPVILFDNVKGVLGGEDIEAFMSAALWQGRILGEKGGFEVENVTTCFFSGNDAKPTRDMQQRCLFVELFLEDIDSSKRKIKNVLTDTRLAAPALRSAVCSALWTLVKAWDAAGRPPAPTTMPKCPEWSAIIGGIVFAAGFGDPCAKPEIVSARGDTHEMRELVIKLAPESTGSADDPTSESWTFSEIIEEVRKHGIFEGMEFTSRKGDDEEMFIEGTELSPAARSHFGKVLGNYANRLFAGDNGDRLRFCVEGKGNQRRYVVRRENPL